jgi:hypothetical protein
MKWDKMFAEEVGGRYGERKADNLNLISMSKWLHSAEASGKIRSWGHR